MQRFIAERLSELLTDAVLNEIEATGVLIRENLIERILRELLRYDDRPATTEPKHLPSVPRPPITTETAKEQEAHRETLAESLAETYERLREVPRTTPRPPISARPIWLMKAMRF
jgi:hypothetical protein